jgi:isopentenyldiphosphate isomerase
MQMSQPPIFQKTYMDTYTGDGHPTGEVHSYDDVHRLGLWHKAVHVWLLNSQGQFLIQKRGPHMHTKPNQYECTAAGHIDHGQTSSSTACKELIEETSINISPEQLEYIGTFVDTFEQDGGVVCNNEFDDVYLVRMDVVLKELVYSEHEVVSLSWHDAREYLKRGMAGDSALVFRPLEYSLIYQYLFAQES